MDDVAAVRAALAKLAERMPLALGGNPVMDAWEKNQRIARDAELRLFIANRTAAALDALEAALAEATARAEKAEAEVARLRNVLDTERYKVAIGVGAIARAVQGRMWLAEPGRGSYAYDDERYQAEFGAALTEIDGAMAPLRKIARDWSDCPRDPLEVAANRRAALAAGEVGNG